MSETVVRSLWERVEARDWAGLAARLDEDLVIDWPHSGERIRGRENYVAMQRDYPGGWRLSILSVSAGPEKVAAEVRVDHGDVVCFGSGFYEVKGDVVVRGTEYWTTARSEAPLAWRAHLCEPMGPP